MYKIVLHKKVIKFIQKRTQKEKDIIKAKLKILAQNPYPSNLNLDIKKMKNKIGFRLRIGDFRFLYDVEEDKLVIYLENANNRGDIY